MAQFNILAARLKEASQEYYTTGKSPISDTAFDLAQDLLKKQNPDAPEVTAVGWGYEVARDSTPGEKVTHKYGLVGSLGKAYSWAEIDSNFKGAMVDCSLKLDGISIVLYYEDGVLVRAVTRGDGVTGIDVTIKIVRILKPSEQKLADRTFTGAVRGEVLMYNKQWEEFKKLHPEAKNSRNSTAGLINAAEVSEDLKFLNVVVYKIVGSAKKPPMSMPTMNTWLAQNFTHTAPHCMGNNFTERECDHMKDLCGTLNGGMLPVDGMVMKMCYLEWNEVTGEVVYQEQAFKFAAEVAVTEVEDIEWNLTKNRLLMPRVKLQTVHISGTDVSWATGYNAEYIAKNHIGAGAIVSVEKHGEIIPNINEIIAPSECWHLPEKCPVCGTELKWEGVHLTCPNEACGNAKLQDLLVWSNVLAPIDGFGDTLRAKYFNQLLGDDISIENLMTNRPVIEDPKGVQDSFCNTMLQKLYGTDPIVTKNAIMCLNIPRIANMNAAKLDTYLAKLRRQGMSWADVINHVLDQRNFYEVAEAVGNANAEAIQNNPAKLERLHFISDRIVEIGMTLIEYTPVAVTGKLSVPRARFEEELKEYGYVVSEIKSTTKYLITDDPNSGSSKNQKADKLGIPKMTEAEFRTSVLHNSKGE